MQTPSRESYQFKLDEYAASFRQLGYHVDQFAVEEIVDPDDENTVVDYRAYMYVNGIKHTISWDPQLGWYLD